MLRAAVLILLAAVPLLAPWGHGRSGTEPEIEWVLLIDTTPSMKHPQNRDRFNTLAGVALEIRRAFTMGPASRPVWRVGDRVHLFPIPGVLEGGHGQKPSTGRESYRSLFRGQPIIEYTYAHSRGPLYATFERALMEMTSLHPLKADQGQGAASRGERGGAALSSTLRLLFLDGFLRPREGRCVITILYSDLEDYSHPLNPPLTPGELDRILSITRLVVISELRVDVEERRRLDDKVIFVSANNELRNRKAFSQHCKG